MPQLIGLFLLTFGFISTSEAHLPFDNLVEKVIREPNPFSFVNFNPEVDLNSDDFVLESRKGEWIPNSFQWVRVGNGKDEVGILIPRARYRENGMETEVALTQVNNPQNVRFRPRAGLKNHVYFDSSCSPYKIQLNQSKIDHSWIMVSCHRINNESDVGTKPVVLVTVIWENEIEGTLTQFNVDSENPKKRFRGKSQDSFEIEAQVAPLFHPLGVSAGIGPYSNRNEVRAFATLYASYYFNDALKVASFGALPFRANPEMDWGLYLVLEQFRGIDERVSLNLLLGAHVLSYVPANGSRSSAMSGPQGVELIFRDLFTSNMNFMVGGFFYPEIKDRSYVNAWVRYGTNQYFLELNFIEWHEPKPAFYSKSFGLSVGFPLFRAL